jgi:hypothetical protein
MQDESDLRQRMLRQVEAAAAAAVLNLRSPSQPPVRERAGRLNTLDSWVRAG